MMLTWLLLPFGFVLSLTFTQGSAAVTGALTGVTEESCPVSGSIDGYRLGLVALCVRAGGASFWGFSQSAAVEPIALVLTIDPVTLSGTWVDSMAQSGTLLP